MCSLKSEIDGGGERDGIEEKRKGDAIKGRIAASNSLLLKPKAVEEWHGT